MRKVKIETHCHSLYSHDSSLAIGKIVEMAIKNGLTHIVICDHDNCGITEDDQNEFRKVGIELVPAIEFTTTEGVHIIGVHQNIAKIQNVPYTYNAAYLVEKLKSMYAIIIIPHPYHNTGLIGNSKVTPLDIDYCLKNANFLEISNYKYGTVHSTNLIKKYPHIKFLVGSDAHSATMVASQFNEFEIQDEVSDVLNYIYDNPVEILHIYRKKHGLLYWNIKKIKKSYSYQFLLNLIPVSLRRNIKNKLFNK